MKLNRLSAALFAGAAVLALTSCAAGAADEGGAAEPAETGGINTDAPLYDLLPQAIKDAGVITIAGDTHPPYRTVEEGGEITGIDPDIQAALAEQFGVPFEIESVSGMEAILTGMLAGRYDGFNGPLRTTPEREAEFDAVVWMTTITSYVYLAEREDELSDPEALCGARVAGVAGSVTESQLERYGQWCVEEGLELPEFIGLKDTNSTFLAVNSDRADYAGTTQTAAIDLQASDEGRYSYLVQSEEQGAGIDQLAFFVPKGNDMAEPLLAAFEAIFDNGEYDGGGNHGDRLCRGGRGGGCRSRPSAGAPAAHHRRARACLRRAGHAVVPRQQRTLRMAGRCRVSLQRQCSGRARDELDAHCDRHGARLGTGHVPGSRSVERLLADPARVHGLRGPLPRHPTARTAHLLVQPRLSGATYLNGGAVRPRAGQLVDQRLDHPDHRGHHRALPSRGRVHGRDHSRRHPFC